MTPSKIPGSPYEYSITRTLSLRHIHPTCSSTPFSTDVTLEELRLQHKIDSVLVFQGCHSKLSEIGAKVTNFTTTFVVIFSLKFKNRKQLDHDQHSLAKSMFWLSLLTLKKQIPKPSDNHSSLFSWQICHIGKADCRCPFSVLFVCSKYGWLKKWRAGQCLLTQYFQYGSLGIVWCLKRWLRTPQDGK